MFAVTVEDVVVVSLVAELVANERQRTRTERISLWRRRWDRPEEESSLLEWLMALDKSEEGQVCWKRDIT
jgi:hypothetical protein